MITNKILIIRKEIGTVFFDARRADRAFASPSIHIQQKATIGQTLTSLFFQKRRHMVIHGASSRCREPENCSSSLAHLVWALIKETDWLTHLRDIQTQRMLRACTPMILLSLRILSLDLCLCTSQELPSIMIDNSRFLFRRKYDGASARLLGHASVNVVIESRVLTPCWRRQRPPILEVHVLRFHNELQILDEAARERPLGREAVPVSILQLRLCGKNECTSAHQNETPWSSSYRSHQQREEYTTDKYTLSGHFERVESGWVSQL